MAGPDLPEEILQLIFSHLSAPEDDEERVPINHTLTSICLVSKQCYRLAQPLLYQTLWLHNQPISTIKLLVRTLIYQPMIAELVRELSLGECLEDEADPDTSIVEIESLESYEDVVNASTSLAEDLRQLVVNGLSEGDLAANVAMLFIVCRNLQNLDIPLLRGYNKFVTGNVLEAAGRDHEQSDEFNDALPLSQLKEIFIRCGNEDEPLRMSDLAWLIHIGRLETFRGDGIEVAQVQPGEYGVPCGVKHLHLSSSYCDAHSLEALLEICELETFGLELRAEGCLITYEWIGSYLTEHARGLREVCVDTSSLSDPWDEGGGMQISLPLGDLSELQDLETLRISAVAIYGKDDPDDRDYPNFKVPNLADILPTSLVLLELIGCIAEQRDAMEKQLDAVWEDTRFKTLECARLLTRGDMEDTTWTRD